MQKDNRTTELNILNYIEQSSDTTQRELSEQVGVSLGTINLLLKKMVKKGLIKIERLQPNSIKYFLTPSGIANKIERTYGYVVRTYNEISRVRSRIITVTNAIARVNHAEHICFFGEGDDLSELIYDLIKSSVFAISCHLYENIEDLLECKQCKNSTTVIVWNRSAEELLKRHNVSCVNVMEMVEI